MTYTNTFGSATVPSAKSKFAAFSLTANQTFFWSYNSSDTAYQVADIMEFTTTAGLSITFPAANQVSVGESALVRNTGSNTFTVLDAAGGTLGTVAAGTAKLFYINDNTSVAGVWSVLTFGTGTSSADATTLQGLGLVAIGATLNTEFPVITTSTAYTITTANRSNTLVFTGGSVNCTLPTLATAVDGFTVLVKNSGSGTITFVPQGAETVDQTTLAPGESLCLIAGAAGWITVGYGRSSAFSFTRLNKSVTGATVSVSTTDAQNKIINFYGTPGVDTVATFPSIASVYYLSSSIASYSVTVKTATGSSVVLAPNDATVVVCDGVNFSVALSGTYATAISLPDGTAVAPSLKFASTTNTGLYTPGAGMIGFCANGAERVRLDNSSASGTFGTIDDLEIGRLGSSPWTPANLSIGYGSIWAGYNGSAGIALTPSAADSDITLDVTKDAIVRMKCGNLASVGAELHYTTAASLLALSVGSTGDIIAGKDFMLDGTGGTTNFGFTTGAGGVVTQATSKATTVVLDKSTGRITTHNASLAANTSVAFTLTNSAIGEDDFVGVNIKSGAASNLAYQVCVVGVAAGSCTIQVRNNTAGALGEALVLNFAVISGASA